MPEDPTGLRTPVLAPTAAELKHLRKAPRRVRFCPNCGWRNRQTVVLHFRCNTCHFEFMVTDREDVQNVRHSGRSGAQENFQVMIRARVPATRTGVGDLVRNLRNSAGKKAAPSNRYSDI